MTENREKHGGSDAVTREAARIHEKAGMKLTGREADLTKKPGPSEESRWDTSPQGCRVPSLEYSIDSADGRLECNRWTGQIEQPA